MLRLMRRAITASTLLAIPASAGDAGGFDMDFAKAAELASPFAFTAGYVRGDEPPVMRSAGQTRISGGEAVGPEAPWHIGSITKSFTATLAMMLAQDGWIDIDAPIGDQFPDLAATLHPDWTGLTLAALMAHVSGLPANIDWHAIPTDLTPTKQRRAALAPLWSQPITGAKPDKNGNIPHRYSNLGYVVVAHLLETKTGQSWEEMVQSRIARPLGLTSLGFGAPAGDGVPWGHQRVFLKTKAMDPRDPRSDNPEVLNPAGRVHVSLRDLLLWGQEHLRACKGQGVLLSQASCRRMQAPGQNGFGFGWVIQPAPGAPEVTLVLHDGSNTMWFAHLLILPERDLVIAAVQNNGRAMMAGRLLKIIAQPLLESR